ncbi:unnamed protein product [Ilex paraguariensis]|uniref:RING-type E3 ubiquitin transferase n=1 Tax=Ilex paraguariensis TaxID=185542 RepID=A0ABC8RCS5_9AQUA
MQMNNTIESTDATDDLGGRSSGSFGFGIGISFGLLAILAIITSGSYICTRWRRQRSAMNRHPSSHRSSIDTTIDDDSVTIQQGLNEATLHTYPKLLYSHAKLHEGDSITSGCSICLVDYKDTDMLRLLAHCGHLFHQNCIDPWLRFHTTCPICRTTPMPTLLATPLTEVVPSSAPQN